MIMFSIQLTRLTLLAILVCNIHATKDLRLVSDSEFLEVIREGNVVALFSKTSCDLCEEYESELVAISEDLAFSLDASVVRLTNSPLSRLFNVAPEPYIVFIRNGIPLLYDGAMDGSLISQEFLANVQPIAKELTDETFEHLTQAASGATTGDWLVMFYNVYCQECNRLQSVWEAVGSRLKVRMNVAKVNIGTTGRVTAKRFDITQVPTFLLLRQGKYYHYTDAARTISAFVEFAQTGYQNHKAFVVPEPISYISQLLDSLNSHLRYYSNQPGMILRLSIGSLIFITTLIVGLRYSRRQAQIKRTEKKK